MTILKFKPRVLVPNDTRPVDYADGDDGGDDYYMPDLPSFAAGMALGIIGALARYWWLS